MAPEERKLVTELFDRLTTLEDAARDPEAEGLIRDGLRQAPNAPYTLVQTVLVQDEALKRANARIRELEEELGGAPEPAQARPAGFLDNVRGALFGASEPQRGTARPGSVPSVRPRETAAAAPAYPPDAQPMAGPYGQGGSFLGTAAATAAGMIGSSLLLGGIRSMMGGGGHGSAHAAASNPSVGSQHDLTTPWSNTQGGDLAREAGIDHIGHSPPQDDAGGDRQGFFDNSADNADDMDDMDADDFDDDGDFGGDDNN
jgi:hypothetical protein